jgi:DNA (cytosine-5)-methyltransferase 1
VSDPGDIIDICAGYGGLSMGLSAVTGARVSAYAEIEPAALAILRRHHPDALNLGDVKTLDWRAASGAQWLCAGCPCQPWSAAGRKLGTDDPRHLWPHIARGIGTANPEFVLLENVLGHVKSGLPAVLDDLAALGYGGAWTVTTAMGVGAPHRRRRVFVLASRHVEPGFFEHVTGDHPQLVNRHKLLPTPEAKLGSSGPDFARASRPNSGGDDLTTIAAKVARGMISPLVYASALEHWETVTGRIAPPMAKPGADRVSPLFGEWMMGLPLGHVTNHGLTAEQELHAIGNGVVPLQASYAVSVLMRTLSQLPRKVYAL